MNRDISRYWPLDPEVTFLTHGTYGVCPWPVLHAQSEWRARMEREPVRFMNSELEPALDAARARLGEFVGADSADLAFLPNATTGVNTVLRSLEFEPGDEILTTDHDYNACINAIRFVGARSGARTVVASLPFSPANPDEVVGAILAAATPRTRLAILSHVTSPTALVMPIQRIVSALSERGIDTLVDGAHAPGMLALDIESIGAAYYTGNAHKWLCAPKGAGFLHVRRDRQAAIRPLVISHGTNSPRTGRSIFRLEFDWLGTLDSSAFLAIPAALDFMASLLPGGWPEVMQRNHDSVVAARSALLSLVPDQEVAPEEMIGSMAAVEIPTDLPPTPIAPSPDGTPEQTWPLDPLRDWLLETHSIEVPVYAWPHTIAEGASARRRLMRVSGQVYNEPGDYERLAEVLTELRDRTCVPAERGQTTIPPWTKRVAR
ncbi:MAG: aminotransferase class V-fold PLP-dependent enzyme [Candidatus Limnocylindrales bacterium]